MTSSTWSCDPGLTLCGIGIDIEDAARFDSFDPAQLPMPFVFTPSELRAALAAPRPGDHLCAIFTIKEALRKALAEPYDYAMVEVVRDNGGAILRLEPLASEHGIAAWWVLCESVRHRREIVAEVYLFDRGETAS